jgi:hypothetical protein
LLTPEPVLTAVAATAGFFLLPFEEGEGALGMSADRTLARSSLFSGLSFSKDSRRPMMFSGVVLVLLLSCGKKCFILGSFVPDPEKKKTSLKRSNSIHTRSRRMKSVDFPRPHCPEIPTMQVGAGN